MPERECLPERRASWTQRVKIGPQTVYLSFGEYADGRLGEVWVEAAKAGSHLRGTLGALARLASVALQHGVPVAAVAEALRGLDYPPNGPVDGSPAVFGCTSLADWIGREIEAAYLNPAPPLAPNGDRVAGAYTSGSGV